MAHFEAEFKDGTIYVQDAEDKSVHTEGRNSFYDVLQRMDEVKRFHVVKPGAVYTVDLTDGHFEVNGVPFVAHDQNYVPSNPKLIYFKEMHQNFRLGEEDPYETKCNRYFIGWEANNNGGKNTKQTIAVPGD